MANCSEVLARYEATGCATEFRNLLEAIGKYRYSYKLLENYEEQPAEGENSAVFEGDATGKWQYSNNLRGYLSRDWAETQVDLVQPIQELTAAIERGGMLTCTWREIECGMCFALHGGADITVEDGEMFAHWDETNVNYDAESIAELMDWDIDYVEEAYFEVLDEHDECEETEAPMAAPGDDEQEVIVG